MLSCEWPRFSRLDYNTMICFNLEAHRCRSRQMFGWAKDFCQEIFWATFCAHIFSWRPFLGWLPKKVFMWFCTRWAPFFSYKSVLGAIFSHIFRDFVRIFTRSKFLGCACTPCTPASYTTVEACLLLYLYACDIHYFFLFVLTFFSWWAFFGSFAE